MNTIHYSSKKHDWETPQELFDMLDSQVHFTLDVCATKENAKCKQYYTLKDDGLRQSWGDNVCWMNPPYGREIGKWVPKEWIESVLSTIKENPQWTFLLLTKNPNRYLEFKYPKNVWLGATVDSQKRAELVENSLRSLRNSGNYNGVIWVSCEPLLEHVGFSNPNLIDWIVIGGSSGNRRTK